MLSQSPSGEIPILLDPALGACYLSAETLKASDSLSSLPISQSESVAGSVGTFGQPVRQRPGDLNIRATSRSRIHTWTNSDSSFFKPSVQSFCGSSHDSFSSFDDVYGTANPGASHSASSTPTSPFFPIARDEEVGLSNAGQDSVFTLSAYLASASVYDNGNEDRKSMLGCGMRTEPGISRSSSLEDQDRIFSELAFDKTKHSKWSNNTGTERQLALPALFSHQPYQALSVHHTPTNISRRDPSELDVPLTPTSTFLLSPSNSAASGIEEPNPESAFPSSHSHQQRHYRAVSAPLSSVLHPSISLINEALEVYNASNEEETPRLRPRPASSSGYISSNTPLHHSNLDLEPQKSESISSQFLKTSSPERNHTTATHDCSATPPWILDTTVELWIDQEGFRLIKPRFELVRYSRKTGSRPNGEVLDVAEFAMRKRQTWHFHHATLDSPPVLHRLAVNGDMNDYISRQATLTLKHNGTYIVESTEDKGKVAWKFEYLIEDRLVPGTGKIMDGEKRFTPLRFVCNPDLLTPEHGKKVKLLQFVRKSVTPKLQSYMAGPMGMAVRPRITVAGPDQGNDTMKPALRYRHNSGDPALIHPMRAQPRTFSDGCKEETSVPLDLQASGDEGTALIGPGQRIMPPSVLHAMFPTRTSARLEAEPGGFLPPPRSGARSSQTPPRE